MSSSSQDKVFKRKRKLREFEKMIDDEYVMVNLDARAEGVIVPEGLKENAALALKLSRLFQGKMTSDDFGINVYLRFSGEYFQCVLPWDSIWSIHGSSGQNVIWNEDVPSEIMIQLAKEKVREFARRLVGKRTKTPTPEPAISTETKTSSPTTENSRIETSDAKAADKRRKSFLHRVK